MALNEKTAQELQELKSSYNVNAETPEPVGGTATPPGGNAPGEREAIRTSPTSVKTKAGMVAAIVKKVSGMSKADVSAVHASLRDGMPAGEQSRPTQGTSTISQPKRVTREEVDATDDLAAIFEGKDLSEEIQAQIAEIFETALVTKINEKLVEMAETTEEETAVEVTSMNEELVEKVDAYLDYVVEQWLDENRLVAESGIRSEIAENLLSGIRDLFTENYISIPEDKVEVVDELATKVEELEAALSEEISRAVELTQEIEAFKRASAIASVSEGLTDVQAAKLAQLTEAVDFDSEENFTTSIKTLRENYFPSGAPAAKPTQLDEQGTLTEEEIVQENKDADKAALPANMRAYVDHLAKQAIV